jgi:uncharacterized coiled-coil protein SlyX
MKYKVGDRFEIRSGNDKSRTIKVIHIKGEMYYCKWPDKSEISYTEGELRAYFKHLKPKKKKNKLEKRVEQLTKNLLYLGKRVTDLEDNQTESEAITPSSKIIVPETPNKKVINPSDKTLEERLEELECEITKRTNTSRCGYDVWFTDSLGWYQLIILEGTEDEIVEKVKQIIEILK